MSEKKTQKAVTNNDNLEEIAATLAETAEELEAEAKENGEGTDVYHHYLRRPFTYEGRTVEELSFDWGALTGRDSLAIERELRTKGITLIAPAYTGEYLVSMAARACTARTEDDKRFVGTDMISALPLGDFQAITNRARNFLLRAGVVTGDGGLWLRQQCIILAKNNNTPVPYWLSMPLGELREWIEANNAVIGEEKEAMKHRGK